MNITFWVTEECNLACRYCYVDKNPKIMSMDVAKQTIGYFSDRFKKTVDDGKYINVAFHGGEPLINFDIIKYMVEILRKKYGKHIKFKLTTNGTIFRKDIFDFLKDNVQVSLSIDGNRATNDINRLYKDGKSSYDDVMRTLRYLKNKKQYIRIRVTVNKDTLPYLADNFIYLDKLDAGVVTFALDAGDKWNQEDMLCYYHNYEKIMDYLIEKNLKEAQYFLFNLKEATFRKRSYCDGGMNTFHIAPDGTIYPCSLAVNKKEYWLGDVYNGINKEKLKVLEKINSQTVKGCESCTFKSNCSSQVCKIINKCYTGDLYTPSAFMCNERNIIYKIYKKYKYILEGFNV